MALDLDSKRENNGGQAAKDAVHVYALQRTEGFACDPTIARAVKRRAVRAVLKRQAALEPNEKDCFGSALNAEPQGKGQV